MIGPGTVLLLARIAAVVGPLVVGWLTWRLVRRGRRRLGWSLAAGAGVAWTLGVWAFLIEPTLLTVRQVTVESERWVGPPLRIGIMSDTHVAAPHTDVARVERVVARMNAERPDIVMLLGDYAGGHEPAQVRAAPERSQVLSGVEAFRALKSPLGTYAVLGNHDSWFDDAAVSAALDRAGVTLLENRAVEAPRPGAPFWIGGVADLDSRRLTASVGETLSAVPEDAPVILMTHWPDPFTDVPRRVAVTLAGHTHCGQVNFPVFGRLVHASRMSKRWACGLYDEGGRKLFVTGGVGVSILPVRFRAPPEIVVLTLRAG